MDLGTAFWTRLTSLAVFACQKRDNTISHEEWPNWDQGMFMCSALNNDGPQGLVTLLKYLTTKANNYWKTMAKNIPFTMPKSVRIFSLFLVNNARLRSNLRNSCFVFHQGFQTLENNKSTQPTAFHQFSRVGKPRWNAWLTLDQPLINAWLTLDQPLINPWLTLDQPLCYKPGKSTCDVCTMVAKLWFITWHPGQKQGSYGS